MTWSEGRSEGSKGRRRLTRFQTTAAGCGRFWIFSVRPRGRRGSGGGDSNEATRKAEGGGGDGGGGGGWASRIGRYESARRLAVLLRWGGRWKGDGKEEARGADAGPPLSFSCGTVDRGPWTVDRWPRIALAGTQRRIFALLRRSPWLLPLSSHQRDKRKETELGRLDLPVAPIDTYVPIIVARQSRGWWQMIALRPRPPGTYICRRRTNGRRCRGSRGGEGEGEEKGKGKERNPGDPRSAKLECLASKGARQIFTCGLAAIFASCGDGPSLQKALTPAFVHETSIPPSGPSLRVRGLGRSPTLTPGATARRLSAVLASHT